MQGLLSASSQLVLLTGKLFAEKEVDSISTTCNYESCQCIQTFIYFFIYVTQWSDLQFWINCIAERKMFVLCSPVSTFLELWVTTGLSICFILDKSQMRSLVLCAFANTNNIQLKMQLNKPEVELLRERQREKGMTKIVSNQFGMVSMTQTVVGFLRLTFMKGFLGMGIIGLGGFLYLQATLCRLVLLWSTHCANLSLPQQF